jgi:hypothetical protein
MATASHIVRRMVESQPRTMLPKAVSGGWHRIMARWESAIDFLVPFGYEDQTGFHYGEVPAQAELESCLSVAEFTADCEQPD